MLDNRVMSLSTIGVDPMYNKNNSIVIFIIFMIITHPA